MYEKGTLVTVQSRTWAGINKPGGVGKIISSTLTSCTVKYILGGSDKDVPTEFVSPFEGEGKRDRTVTSETTGGVVDRGETGERRRERGGGRNRGEGREEVFREVDVNEGGGSPVKRAPKKKKKISTPPFPSGSSSGSEDEGQRNQQREGKKKKKKKKKSNREQEEQEEVITAKPITEVVLDRLSPSHKGISVPVNPLMSKFTTFLLKVMEGADEMTIEEIQSRWTGEEGGEGGEVEGMVKGMEQRNAVMVDEGVVYKI